MEEAQPECVGPEKGHNLMHAQKEIFSISSRKE
jgi:hypothetical protein